MCIDQEIADRLAVKRKRRGAVDRLFVKQHRHEITAGGGYYASDLLSGTYLYGGSYTYHMTDETAVEFAGWWTHANADIIRALEDKRGTVLTDTYSREIFAESLLVWSPVYGKLRLGGSIVHFDLHADLGVGVIDSNTSRGAAGVVGFGLKLFMGQAVAFRIDARNRTFRQDERRHSPQLQLGGQPFAVAGQIGNQPQPWFLRIACRMRHHRRHECLRRLGGVIEHDLAVACHQWGEACGEFRLGNRTADPAVRAIVLSGHAAALCPILVARKRDPDPDRSVNECAPSRSSNQPAGAAR
jgi:outer membrane beta-barrel protein